MTVQVHDLFGDIPAFVNGSQIPEVIECQPKLPLLTVKLAITVDAMKPFV